MSINQTFVFKLLLSLFISTILLTSCGSSEDEPQLIDETLETPNSEVTGSVNIIGLFVVGETLTISQSLADENGLGTFNYQWLRGGVNISGATSDTYLLIDADAGQQISVEISFTDLNDYAESVLSDAFLVAEETAENVVVTGEVQVTGVFEVGQTLSVTQTLADENGLGNFAYQWLRNSIEISGAVSATYELVDADVGQGVSVTIRFTDGDNYSESVTSDSVQITQQTLTKKPNILLIISDDQGIDASAQYPYSNDVPTTPTLDELAQSGVTFENVWATPACTTTRGTLMTGQHGVNSGVTYVPATLNTSLTSLPKYIKTLDNGAEYQTGAFGKWHLGGGNSSDDHPTESGFDYYAGNLSNPEDYYEWSLLMDGVSSTSTTYHTTKVTDLVIDWITLQNDSDTPWLSWVAYSAPHTPYHLPPLDLHTRDTLTGENTDIDAQPREYLLAAVEAMDAEIGRLIASMSDDVLDNTIIIYVGDNGTSAKVIDKDVFSRSNSKGSLSEGGIRVPLVVTGKGVLRANQRESALINTTDLFATIGQIIEQSGALASDDESKSINDSISFSTLLAGEVTSPRSLNYAEYESDSVTGWTVRNDSYKLIELGSGEQFFYKVDEDLDETTDLINDSELQSVIAEFENYAAIIRGETTSTTETDITDQILTARNSNCADYVESYKSTVLDVNRSVVFHGSLKITVIGDKCIFTSNMIPNHDFNDGGSAFPNDVSEQNVQFEMVTSPQVESAVTPIDLSVDNAIMLNGVKVDLLAAACFEVGNEKVGCNDMSQPWRFDPMFAANGFRVDSHNAHAQPDGSYHYHGTPNALFNDDDDSTASPVIGFAADGFPIFGSYFDDGSEIRKATPSYQLIAGDRPTGTGNPGGQYDGTYRDDYEFVEGLGDLDECNGMVVDGVYGYFITEGYPYVLPCFTGTPDSSFSK